MSTSKVAPVVDSARVQLARNNLKEALTKFLKQAGSAAADAVLATEKKLNKLRKAPKDDDEELRYLTASYQSIDWESIVSDVEDELEEAASEGGMEALLQVDFSDADMISAANDIAAAFAKKRSAELVGMKYNDAGELVQNPNAKWAITETTRDDLRDLIEQSFEQETPIDELAEAIRDAATFSEARAEMIANTEVQRAQVSGSLDTWKQTGLNIELSWQLSNLDPCVICLAFSEDGPYPLKSAPVPVDDSHPNCRCVLRVESVEAA